ncbi:MAG: prephenate dehydrogenase/arogenate dehydrogenase family protein [Spirochaetia bacterium]|nr:prephenate dehydrogenase/arogenate dehydrogenase family protein [Spirochaetia bacterium]
MKVGVYGLGRFGAFWATQLSKKVEVVGYNRSKRDLIIDGVKLVDFDSLCSCDVIFLCVSISSLQEVLNSIKDHISDDTLVIDTCSVKVYPAQLMSEILHKGQPLIATHPMFGPDSAKEGLRGLPLVFHPLRCSVDQKEYWITLFKEMEIDVIEMSPQEHDKEAAYSQGVTHFVGRMLDELHLKPTKLATVGYKRLMSIVEQTCNDPLQLFYDLQRYNPYAHYMRSELKEASDKILTRLKIEEVKKMEDA